MTRRRWSTTARLAIFNDAKGLCHICGGKIDGKAWELEHVRPLAQGGEDDASNLRPAHVACHKTKTAEDNPATSKAKRREAIHKGAKAPPRQKIASAGFQRKERAPKPAPIGLCEFARRIR